MPKKPVMPPAWVMTMPNFLQSWFLRWSRCLQPGGMAVFDLVLQCYATFGMAKAAELGIADFLKAGPRSAKELAELCSVDAQALYRLLRALASQGIFHENRRHQFRNTSLSRALAEGPGSMKYMVLSHLNPDVLAMFGDLRYSLVTGKSAAVHRFGTDVFSFLETKPLEHEHFVRAMGEASALSAPVILSACNFSKFKHLVDLGGGSGKMLAAILELYPKLSGTLFDRPDTIIKAQAESMASAQALRIEYVAGDFFVDNLPGGDLFFLKNILHDWDDEQAGRILTKIRGAINPAGKLVVVEFVIPSRNRPSPAKLSDLLMLAGLEGARERTAQEFRSLLETHGFRLSRIKRTVAPFCILEGTPV